MAPLQAWIAAALEEHEKLSTDNLKGSYKSIAKAIVLFFKNKNKSCYPT